jgi:hypothetical protein
MSTDMREGKWKSDTIWEYTCSCSAGLEHPNGGVSKTHFVGAGVETDTCLDCSIVAQRPPLNDAQQLDRASLRVAELTALNDDSLRTREGMSFEVSTLKKRVRELETLLYGAPTQPLPEDVPVDIPVWGYAASEDAERWSGSCSSEEQAIAEGRAEYGLYVHFVVRSGVRYAARRFMPDAADILSLAGDSASDEAGEAAEDFPDASEEAKNELELLLDNWADRRLGVTQFWVADGPIIDIGEDEHNGSSMPVNGQLSMGAAAAFACCGGTDGGKHRADCSERAQDDCETED